MPKTRRPPDITSTQAACLARSPTLRYDAHVTIWPMRAREVMCASAAITVHASKQGSGSRRGPVEEVVELLDGVDAHPEMVEGRRGHRRIVGDEEHELVIAVGRHDELLAIDRLGRELLPAEHLLVEAHDVGAALLVQGIGRHAH